MWVRSKYTSELAVLAAWVSLFVPWNIVYHTKAPVESTVYFFRFPLFELQIRQPTVLAINDQPVSAMPALDALYPGWEVAGALYATVPPASALEYSPTTLQQAGWIWTGAAVVFLLAFVLSLALYIRTEATIELLPVSEVRLMGALLGIAALGTGASTVLYYVERSVAGLPIPIGVLIVGAFSVVLLLIEEVPDEELTDEEIAGEDATAEASD